MQWADTPRADTDPWADTPRVDTPQQPLLVQQRFPENYMKENGLEHKPKNINMDTSGHRNTANSKS